MRYFLLLVIAAVGIATAAKPVVPTEQIEQGTLTLEGNKIIFKGKGELQTYDLGGFSRNSIPGLKVINYEKKANLLGKVETDVSELTVETNEGKTIILIMSKPVDVNRITNSSGMRWELRTK